MTFDQIAQIVFFTVLGVIAVLGIFAASGARFALAWLDRIVDVKPVEVRAMLVAWLYFFCTLASSFTLRPIRDAMAVASGARNLPYLFTATLTAMVCFHPVYSSFVGRFPVKRFVAITYGFFALNLVAFFVAWKSGVSDVWTGRVFYVWHAVFNVFMTSVFWSVMADTFHTSQAKRLFGFIGVGGTIGAVSGSAVTALFVKQVGTNNMLFVSIGLLIGAAILVIAFPSVPRILDDNSVTAATDQNKIIGGSVWSGILSVFRSRYIAGIAVFLMLYTIGSTFLYSAQTTIIGEYFKDRNTQTLVLARMETVTQLLTAFIQAFITARAIRVGGLALTISAVPVVSILGFAALGTTGMGLAPVLWTFIVFNVARRASDFSLTQPSRKILFTVLHR